MIPCQCSQQTIEKQRHTHLLKYSNLGALSHFTFDNLSPRGRSGNAISQEQFVRAYQTAKAFASDPNGWLVLIGPSNCGKTHLAAAIANERIKQGKPAFFVSAPDLLDRLRSTFSPESEIVYDQFFEQVRNTPLLILDDLGAQTSTSWAKEKLVQLLNYRFNSQLPTIIVPTIPMEKLEDRIRSRLTDTTLSQICVVKEEQDLSEYGWGAEFELQKSMTFDRFERRINLPPEQQQNLENALELALNFAKSPEGWLVFMGMTGCGKTHLAAAIKNYRNQARQPALFVVVPEFLDHLRSTFSPESKVSYDQLFEKVKTAPLLILDDFGEQSTTPWAKEKLYQVISYRHNAQLPTVITTRYNLDEISENIETAITSRMLNWKFNMVFGITAPDYRTSRDSGKKPNRSKRGRWS